MMHGQKETSSHGIQRLLVTNVRCSGISTYTNSKVISVPVSEFFVPPFSLIPFCHAFTNGRLIKLVTCPVVCEIRITAVSHKVSREVPNRSALALI